MTGPAENRDVLSRAAREPDEQWAYGDHPDQVADVWHGESALPVVVFLHGGFWRPEYDRTHARPLGEALADRDRTVVSLEYRREPGDPDLTCGDVGQALDRLPDLMDLPNGYLLVGHSAGGHLALLAATALNPVRLRGVLALAPVADLTLAERLALDEDAVPAFLGGRPRDDLDPTRRPAPIAPVTVVHGTDDRRVPPEVSASYVAAHPTATLVPLRATGHFDLIDPHADAWVTVLTHLAP